jgi:hypothetical protein
MFDEDDNGIFGDGENVVWPYALLIHMELIHTMERTSPNTVSRVINSLVGLVTTAILVNFNWVIRILQITFYKKDVNYVNLQLDQFDCHWLVNNISVIYSPYSIK